MEMMEMQCEYKYNDRFVLEQFWQGSMPGGDRRKGRLKSTLKQGRLSGEDKLDGLKGRVSRLLINLVDTAIKPILLSNIAEFMHF